MTVAAHSYTYEAVDGPVGSAAAAGDADDVVEVDYDPAFANMVRLIGTVGGKRDLKVFERSKLLPFAIGIKTDRRKPEETEWINVEAWGPLAERADQVLAKGDRVAVQGRLKVDKWEDRATGAKRTAYKVVASSLSKVRRSSYPAGQFGAGGDGGEEAVFGGGGGGYGESDAAAAAGGAQMAPWDPPTQQQQQQKQEQQGGGAGQQTSEELWMDFFENPTGWYDNRLNKRNPKAPDFKKKEGGREAAALWLSGRSTPGWVEGELQRLDTLHSGGGS